MQIGDHLELDITDVAFGGDGVGRNAGRVIFVPYVLPGERVTTVITELKSRYARAECIRVLAPAPGRVVPPCPYYGDCGGCHYQHADYPLQLQIKRKQVTDIFQRIGGFSDPPVESMAASPLAYNYRNKITLHGPGRPGFRRHDNSRLMEIERCALACESINQKLADLAGVSLGADENLVIRCNVAGEVFTYREYADRSISKAVARSLESAEPDAIHESLAGLSFQLPVRSFFQVNHAVHELLVACVSRLFKESACEDLIDAYCGVGVIAIALAGQAKNILGIESDPLAISCAPGNAARLGMTHCRFRPGRVESLLGKALRECKAGNTCVVLDPPRAGCDNQVIRVLAEAHPRHVLYLSCVPPILARDLKSLRAGGYELKRVIPFDMFPQTAHSEVLAELVLP